MFEKAGIESAHEIKKVVAEAKKFIFEWTEGTKSFVTDRLNRFRDHDAKKIVENVREAIDPMVHDAGKAILKLVEDRASGIGDNLVAGAQRRVDEIVNRSIKTTLSDTRALLAKESPLVAGIERAADKVSVLSTNINLTIERAHSLVPQLRDMAGFNDQDAAKKTMDDIKRATQNLKEFVVGGNSLIPQLNEVLKEWHAEKERERNFNWRVVLGNTAAGLLFVTFAYAVYLKLGWKVTPVRAISLFWLGISVPIMLLNIRSLVTVWATARKQKMESEVHRHILGFKNVVNLVVLLVLVAGNLILNLWLADPMSVVRWGR